MEHRQHILVIEDNVMLAERWARQVFHRLDNVEVHIAHNEEDALNRIAHGKVDAIVSGYYFSEFHREGLRDRGFALIMHAVQALGRSVPVVFVARDVSPKDSFEAAKLGG